MCDEKAAYSRTRYAGDCLKKFIHFGFVLRVIETLSINTGYTFLQGHLNGVNSVRFSPDGRWIASGGEDALVKVCELYCNVLYMLYIVHVRSIFDIISIRLLDLGPDSWQVSGRPEKALSPSVMCGISSQ